MTAKIQSPKDKDHPMRDVSPELEIMEVRKVKRSIQAPIPITKAPMVKPRTTVIPNQSSPKVNPVPVPIQKRESFDMSMIDPALRGIGASCKSSKASISLASESRMLGLKRPAESMENLASKRLKEIPPLINQVSP